MVISTYAIRRKPSAIPNAKDHIVKTTNTYLEIKQKIKLPMNPIMKYNKQNTT